LAKAKLNELQLTILEIINNHIGYDNRISRQLLCKELLWRGFEIKDRNMREQIEFLRSKAPGGAYICSTTAGGYWRAKDMAELTAYIEQDRRRAKMILARLRNQEMRASKAMTMVSLG
jgi:hypothetical protein